MRLAGSSRQEGAALLIVLWMLLLLSLLATSFAVTQRSDLQMARNGIESARARELADAGVSRAVAAVGQLDPRFRWRVDGTDYRWAFGGGTVIISIAGENGKIDVNNAPAAVLESLFRHVGADDDLAARLAQEIVDRRDAMASAARNGGGTGGLAAGTAAFLAIDQLGDLPGMTPRLLQAVLPLVTVNSGAAKVDPDTATRAVLLSLPGADATEIETFLASRTEGAAQPSASIALPASIAGYLAPAALSAVTIRADARTDRGAEFVRDALVLLRDGEGSPYVVERWAQDLAAP
jgi:general secretion pathway protein K